MEKVKRFIAAVLESNVVFMILFLSYPLLFFMSANPAFYLPVQYFIALSCVVLVALLLSATIELLFHFFRAKPFFSPCAKQVVYLVVAFGACFIPFYKTIRPLLSGPIFLVTIFIGLFLCALAETLRKNRKIFKEARFPDSIPGSVEKYRASKKPFNQHFFYTFVMLLSLTCVTLYTKAIITGEKKDRQFAEKLNALQEVEGLKFISRPNVYYFYMESYHGQEAMIRLFNYDNIELNEYLNKENFTVYNNTYANYFATLVSLSSTFMMKHHYYSFENPAMDVRHMGREILGGGKHNTVLSIFRDNGYKINYFLPTDYYFSRTVGIDFYNRLKFNPWATLSLYTIPRHVAEMMSPIIPTMAKQIYKSQITPDYFPPNYVPDMRAMIKQAHKQQDSQFFFIAMPAGEHIKYSLVEEGKQKELSKIGFWKIVLYKYIGNYFKEYYISRIKKSNTVIKEILSQIIADDPNAVIILLGDHGTFKYRNIDRDGQDKMLQMMTEDGITSRDFADSLFNVLLAIRMPQGLTLPDAEVISNVNVFRYVLSALSGTRKLIENKEEDISLTSNVIAVRDGKPLEKLEFIDIQKYRDLKWGF
jgi:hypothetical protein